MKVKFTQKCKKIYIGIILFIFVFIIYLFLYHRKFEGLTQTEIITNNPINPNTLTNQSVASILTSNGIPLNDANMGFSFTITLNKRANSNWQQIFGITPDGPNNATDKRILAAWICPGTTFLHIRTSTKRNSNFGITDSLEGLSLNTPTRIDIIRNKNTFTVSLFDLAGNKIKTKETRDKEWKLQQTKTVDSIQYNKNRGYIYSTYSNFHDLFSGEIKNMIYLISNDPITNENLKYHI